MSSFHSILTLLIVIGYAFISFFYYHQDFGWEISFFKSFTFFTTIMLCVLFILRIFIRWQKLFLTDYNKGFKITKLGWKRSMVNEGLSFFIYIPIIVLLLIYLSEGVVISFVLIAYFIEGILHIYVGKKRYRLIVNERALVIFKNNQKIISWDKIKSISIRHQGILILEKTGRQNHIKENDFSEYKRWCEKLMDIANKRRIFIEKK